MSSTERHPHIDRPGEEEIRSILPSKSPEIQEVYLEAHRLIRETLPDVNYSIDTKDGGMGYGVRQYGYDGWGMAALSAHTSWVSLYFFHGTDLTDPDGILEGTGKRMRHVKLRSVAQLDERRSAIRKLVEEASRLHAKG